MARPRSDIAPRLVEAARARFLEEGVDGASLRAIAADAGTSVGMLHYYFPTKDELFLAVVEEPYAAFVADLSRALAPAGEPGGGDVAARLGRLYARIAAMSEREAVTLRLVVREALVSSTRLARILARFQRGHIPLLVATLTDGVRAGEVRADVPPLLLAIITFALGVVPTFAARQVRPTLPPGALPSDAALPDLLLSVLRGGLAPPTAPPPASGRRPRSRVRGLPVAGTRRRP